MRSASLALHICTYNAQWSNLADSRFAEVDGEGAFLTKNGPLLGGRFRINNGFERANVKICGIMLECIFRLHGRGESDGGCARFCPDVDFGSSGKAP